MYRIEVQELQEYRTAVEIPDVSRERFHTERELDRAKWIGRPRRRPAVAERHERVGERVTADPVADTAQIERPGHRRRVARHRRREGRERPGLHPGSRIERHLD